MSNPRDETKDVTIQITDEEATQSNSNEETTREDDGDNINLNTPDNPKDDDPDQDEETEEEEEEEEEEDDPAPPSNPEIVQIVPADPLTEAIPHVDLVGYNFTETISIALHYGFIVIVIIFAGALLTPDDYFFCTENSAGAKFDEDSGNWTCYMTDDPAMPPLAWTAMGASIFCFICYTTLISNQICEFFYADNNRFDVFKEKIPPKFLPRNVRRVILYSTKVVELLSLVTCDYANSVANVNNSSVFVLLFAAFNSLEICIELFQNAYKQMKLRKKPSLEDFVCFPEFYTFLVVVLGFYAFWGFVIAMFVYAGIGLLVFPFIICAVKCHQQKT